MGFDLSKGLRLHFFISTALVVLFFARCGNRVLEVDIDKLREKIYEPTAVKYQPLERSTILYLDHSTCVIDARQNSRVFNALRSQLGQYSDSLCLIKGTALEKIPLDRSNNQVFQVLQTIQQDIPYADILQAVEQICYGNQQAILITDCEFIKGGLCHDVDPYLLEPFAHWLEKGHVIYVVTEPYQEKNKGKVFDKNRFYFIFSDDRMEAPISHNLLNEIQPLLYDSICKLYKLTNSDISVQRTSKMFAEDLDISDVTEVDNFQYVEILSDWNTIREYVMKLDKYGEPLPDENGGSSFEKAIPFIENLTFNNGENYVITDVEIVATDITAQYVALEDLTVTPNGTNISEGFAIDKDALKENKLNVFVTDKIFNLLSNEFGGNLIRLDFVIMQAKVKDYDSDMFTWQSIYNNPEKAICVSLSIKNVLSDMGVLPTTANRRVIHTVFLKTQSYK
jgi:hypothetical protein